MILPTSAIPFEVFAANVVPGASRSYPVTPLDMKESIQTPSRTGRYKSAGDL